jgi:hypothetical protein
VAAVGAGAVVAANAAGSGEESDGADAPPIEVRGVVNGRQVPNPNGSGTVCGPPIAGAVVSTSLDSATATTGGDGRFRLVTQTPSRISCQTFTVTITAVGWPTYSATDHFDNRNSPDDMQFCFIPPRPMTPFGPCP